LGIVPKFQGKISSMESAGAIEIWHRSLQNTLPYTSYIGDWRHCFVCWSFSFKTFFMALEAKQCPKSIFVFRKVLEIAVFSLD